MFCLYELQVFEVNLPLLVWVPSADATPAQTLVSSTSADSVLQQQAVLELLQLCRSGEGCDERLLAECISQGGVEVS